MSDNELIRRGDVLPAALTAGFAGKFLVEAIATIPAVTALEQKRCGKCNGRGYIQWHPSWDNGNDTCDACNGKGSA